MKNLRIIATSVAVSLVAVSCGGGSESSVSTERTRNASTAWAATTTPTKMVVYGTQDGHIEALYVRWDTPDDTAITIGSITPGTAWRNAIASVAVDTARSEVIFSGTNQSNESFLTKMNMDGTAPQNIFTSPNGIVEGMGYDPTSRIAVMQYLKSGSGQYLVQSVDDAGTPLISKSSAGRLLPAFNGIDLYGANTEIIGLADSLEFNRFVKTSVSIRTPRDISSLAQDTQSGEFYGGRHTMNQLLRFDIEGSGNDKIESISQPSSVAVFSDGTVVVGIGNTSLVDTPMSGGLAVVDPSGATSSPLFLSYFGTGATSAAVQSVWAVESPISVTAPSISGGGEVGQSLTCNDATWKDDLPLSRLSRAPIATSRSYAWFMNGRQIADAYSETFVPEGIGAYQCAVTAANFAGSGRSAQSEELKVVAASTTTTVEATTTTLEPTTTRSSLEIESGYESSGSTTTTTIGGAAGSESSSSPVVAVPTVTPGTPIVLATPALKSARWTFKGRTAKVTFKKWSGAKKYRLSVAGATRKTVTCKTVKTTVTCTTNLRKGINSFSAKALSTSGITLALSTKTRNIK